MPAARFSITVTRPGMYRTTMSPATGLLTRTPWRSWRPAVPDLPFWIPVLWLAGVGPAGLAFAFIARHRTGSVAARAAWAKRAAVFSPGALLAGLFTVLGLVYGQLILCLVTIPADRHAAQRAAADAALRTAQRDLRLSEAASARLDEELRCQEAGEAGSGTLTAAVSSQGKAAIPGGGVISS